MTAATDNQIMLIEDEPEVREATRMTMELAGMTVQAHERAVDALGELSSDYPGIVLSDIKMPGMDGMALLSEVQRLDPELPVILITGHGDIAMAVEAVRCGAHDFIEKPADPERLIEEVKRAQRTRTLVLENRRLKAALAEHQGLESKIVGNSPPMVRLRELILTLAEADVDVLINGETGTGKELVARCLHDASARREGRFVALNCGGLPESVIESELFGHEVGAFTGASKRRIGKLEYASGGTLFLDELESMPPSLQIKLLRVLQERALERLGGNDSIAIDVRVVAASKRDLGEASRIGEFREDLYYRLNVAPLDLPPLREHREDIGLLFAYFLEPAAKRFRRSVPSVAPSHLDVLVAHHWPGNVRELQHEAERFVLGISSRLHDRDGEREESASLPERLARYERQLLCEALTASRGRVGEAADRLGIPRKKLYLRMQRHGIDKLRFCMTGEGEEGAAS